MRLWAVRVNRANKTNRTDGTNGNDVWWCGAVQGGAVRCGDGVVQGGAVQGGVAMVWCRVVLCGVGQQAGCGFYLVGNRHFLAVFGILVGNDGFILNFGNILFIVGAASW